MGLSRFFKKLEPALRSYTRGSRSFSDRRRGHRSHRRYSGSRSDSGGRRYGRRSDSGGRYGRRSYSGGGGYGRRRYSSFSGSDGGRYRRRGRSGSRSWS